MRAWERVTILLAALLALFGCGRSRPPGTEDVPPGLPDRPGVYTDIDPRWSHDGKHIAFLRATPDRRLQLYITSPDMGHPLDIWKKELVSPDRPYSSELRRYCSPDTLAWSPDDREIAFERIEWFTFDNGERLPGTGLWSFDLDTGRILPLALHKSRYKDLFYYFHTPQWSPDGRYLAFVGEGINGQRSIFVRPLHAQKAQEVVPRFDNYADNDWPAWRPHATGGRPVLAFRQGIVNALAAPDTETLRRLQPGGMDTAMPGEMWRMRARDYARMLPPNAAADAIAPRAGHLAWSPDGRRLAYTLTPNANDYTRYELWVIRADGRGARRVSPHNGLGYMAPVWIDNRRLGALSPDQDRYDVVVLNVNTGAMHTLGAIDSADCDWSPDRTQIVYAPPIGTVPANGAATTLRLFNTGLSLRAVQSAAAY